MLSVAPEPGIDESELIRLVASLERASEHPLAQAIVDAAAGRGLAISEVQDFEYHPGQGVVGTVDGKAVVAGNEGLLRSMGIATDDLIEAARIAGTGGRTIIFAAIDGRPAGVIPIADPIRSSTADAIAKLKAEGIRLVMLTGDTRATAEDIAHRLRIDEFQAEVLPHEKVEVIQQLQKEGRIVAMAGDGINDAPALAQADVGIAMGTGTDIAMESGDVILIKGDLSGIVRARKLSKATMRNIRQNLFFAFVYNALGVPIAAGMLYPFFGLLLSPIIAAAAMSFSSVSVITNSLRLRKARL